MKNEKNNYFLKGLLYLLPSIGSSFVYIFSFPFLTKYLNPSDYGAFALYSTAATIISAISNSSGISQISSYNKDDLRAYSKLIMGKTYIFSFLISIFLSIIFYALEKIYTLNYFGLIYFCLNIAILAGILGVAAAVVNDYSVVSGRALPFVISQLICSFASPITSLILIQLGVEKEYILISGLFVANFLQFLFCVIFIGGINFRLNYKTEFKEFILRSSTTSFSSIIEWVNNFIERLIIVHYAGLTGLGLLTHSITYKNLLNSGIKGLIRSIWPLSIKEAQFNNISFSNSSKYWRLIDLGIFIFGVIFFIYGELFINLISNNKFGNSFIYVVGWSIVLLIHNLQRPYIFILHATGGSFNLGKVNLYANLIYSILIFPLIYLTNEWGPVILAIITGISALFLYKNLDDKKIIFNYKVFLPYIYIFLLLLLIFSHFI